MSDSISRQDAIEALMNDSDWADAIPTIKSLPSSESKTGRWVWDDKGYFHCDRCGKKPNDQTRITDFCPNRGSFNGGGEDD